MQSNNVHWLHKRGISDNVIALFNINPSYDHPQMEDCIKIPYSPHHSKYRRNPNDERKPKYLYDSGGKVTLYGADKINHQTGVNILITEGELDTLVAWSHNIPAVSSTGGALSWQEEWAITLAPYTVYICFDNDEPGAKGMVKILDSIPDAHIILLPDKPGVKDISDYVQHGGDLHQLLSTAKQYPTIESVKEDMQRREATWQSTHFHKAYLDKHQQDLHKTTYTPQSYEGNDRILKAKSYPLTNLITFTKKKALCPWHNESTPSLAFYPKTNSAYCFGCGKVVDSIEAYRHKHGVGFKQAVDDLNDMV